MEAVIIASGSFTATKTIIRCLKQADLLIAADGGAVHLFGLTLAPSVVIGDMDSIRPDVLKHFKSQHVPFVVHSSHKDLTDTELCIDYALARGASRITLLGVTGVRLDHTLSNVFSLKRLEEAGVEARIVDGHNEIRLVSQSLTLKGRPGDILSLVPITAQVKGVTLTGLEYPLQNATLNMGEALGVSNRFLGNTAGVSISSGLLLAIRARD